MPQLRVILAACGLIRLLSVYLIKSHFRRPTFTGGFGERLATYLEALGGAYLKAGQMLATRQDLFPHDVLAGLRRLHDDVKPMSESESRSILAQSLSSSIESVFSHFDGRPVASGSVAQVHRAVLLETSEVVAVKIKRAGIDRIFDRDARVMQWMARFLARWPTTRRTPFAEGLNQVANALAGQTDFRREVAFHRLAYTSMNKERSVLVAHLVEGLCTPTIIVMEYIQSTRPIGDVSPSFADRRLVVVAVRALYRMIFTDGIIHCDMHPGNVLATGDGRLALVDFGFAATVSARDRRAFAEFFLSLAVDDADAVAAIVCETATGLPPNLDMPSFKRDIGRLVHGAAGRTAEEFVIATFVKELFAIQRHHDISGSPAFTMAILSLLALEGTIRRVYPGLEFQREAIPFVMGCLGDTLGGVSDETLPKGELLVPSDAV